MKNSLDKYINGRSCAILGLGVSNLPLAEHICNSGAALRVYDKAERTSLDSRAEALWRSGAEYVRTDSFEGIVGELVFRSPGIRPDRISAEKGAELTSEMELFLRLTEATAFGITGSDGKTTSTTLTGLFLAEENKRAGKGQTFVGGNIGKPLLTLCDSMTEEDNAVLELSSFQLTEIKQAPRYAAITNVSPNHLDWHTGMEEYAEAKKNIVGENTIRLVTNAECEETVRIARELSGREGLRIVLFSSKREGYSEIFGDIAPAGEGVAVYEKDGYIVADDGKETRCLLSLEDIMLPGRHNVENYMTAIGLTLGKVDGEIYGRVARGFFGVEHRLELVRELEGVRFYNSSIDSSPTRTAAALSAMAGKSIVLICGGYDKKIPYAPLAKAIVEHGGVHTVSLTGATGRVIAEEIEKYTQATGKGREITVQYDQSFDGAVEFARRSAREGDNVLLSPASASFDAFKNFAHRGQTFKKIVMEM